MSASKRAVTSPAALVEDAVFDDLLSSSAEDAAAELHELGIAPEEAVERARQMITDAQVECARHRMTAAKARLAEFRVVAPNVVSLADRERQRARLNMMKRQATELTGMTIAARKSEGLSERDEEGLLDDLADLERMERETGEDGDT